MNNLLIKEQISEYTHLRLARDITVDDIEVHVREAAPNFDNTWVRGGLHIVLKPDVIRHILSEMGVKVTESGEYVHHVSPLGDLTSRRSIDPVINECTHFDFSRRIDFRGVRGEIKKQVKQAAVIAEVENLIESNRESSIAKGIANIQRALVDALEQRNRDFVILVEQAVVNLNVEQEWLEKHLPDRERAQRIQDDVDDLTAQINALKEKKRQLEDELYAMKREVIEQGLLSKPTTGAATAALIAELKEKRPGKGRFGLAF